MDLNAAELLGIAEEVQTFGTKVAAVVRLGEVLGKIGSVVQAADEADARRAKAVADADAARAEVERLKFEAKGLDAARDRVLSGAQAEAEALRNAANEEAGQVKAKAEADAKATIDAASVTATGIVSAAKAEAAAAAEETMRAANELAGIEAKRDAALAELQATNTKIAEAKAAIAKALA